MPKTVAFRTFTRLAVTLLIFAALVILVLAGIVGVTYPTLLRTAMEIADQNPYEARRMSEFHLTAGSAAGIAVGSLLLACLAFIAHRIARRVFRRYTESPF
jgi:uncharacterized protein YjeT (DUF2065 family)